MPALALTRLGSPTLSFKGPLLPYGVIELWMICGNFLVISEIFNPWKSSDGVQSSITTSTDASNDSIKFNSSEIFIFRSSFPRLKKENSVS